MTTQRGRQVSKDSNFYGNEHGEDYSDAELGNKTLSNSDRNETSDNITKRFRAAGGRSILGRSLAYSYHFYLDILI